MARYEIIKRGSKRVILFKGKELEVKSKLSPERLDVLLAKEAISIIKLLLTKRKKKPKSTKSTIGNRKMSDIKGAPLKAYTTGSANELIKQLSDPKQYGPTIDTEKLIKQIKDAEDNVKAVEKKLKAAEKKAIGAPQQLAIEPPKSSPKSPKSTKPSPKPRPDSPPPVSGHDKPVRKEFGVYHDTRGGTSRIPQQVEDNMFNLEKKNKQIQKELDSTKTESDKKIAEEKHKSLQIQKELANKHKAAAIAMGRSAEGWRDLYALARKNFPHIVETAGRNPSSHDMFDSIRSVPGLENHLSSIDINNTKSFRAAVIKYVHHKVEERIHPVPVSPRKHDIPLSSPSALLPEGTSTEKTDSYVPLSDKEKEQIRDNPLDTDSTDEDEDQDGEGLKKQLDKLSSNISPGLWNYQINKYLAKLPFFRGTFSPDTLHSIKILPNTNNSFIYNLMPVEANQPGHWVAVNIIKNPPTLEYYDPFGQKPQEFFNAAIKPLLRSISSDKFQYKINRIQDQSTSSANCGFFAMRFLLDRNDHKPFKVVTKFEDHSLQGEKQINKFKQKNFAYI
jgi:hypothetical protein